ncbi:hypothetical protein BD309DRAFT_953238 [Dichomitus squalens]|nr:hypothetical protein BD309DRAFT_953238 [Dichomitus squalens]
MMHITSRITSLTLSAGVTLTTFSGYGNLHRRPQMFTSCGRQPLAVGIEPEAFVPVRTPLEPPSDHGRTGELDPSRHPQWCSVARVELSEGAHINNVKDS